MVDTNGIWQQPEKLKSIEQFPVPTKIKELRRFLGVCNWYSQFVNNYTEIAAPLTERLKNDVRWRWTHVEQRAFETIKHALCNSPRLAAPDFEKPFCLQTDASEVGVGAILFQRAGEQGRRNIIAYASKKLSDVQRRYAAHERECLAAFWAINKFRPYLESGTFELLTDNAALTWLNKAKEKNSKLTRWALQLGNLSFTTAHVPGTENEGPDMLSRFPTEGEPVDEDELENNLIGAPITPARENKLNENLNEMNNLLAVGDLPDVDIFENHEIFKKWQETEAGIKKIIDALKTDGPARNTRNTKLRGYDTRVDGRLRHEGKLVIPRDKTNEIIRDYHDVNLACHPGWKETYRAVNDRYFWRGMVNDVRNYVRRTSMQYLRIHETDKPKAIRPNALT